MIAADAKRVRLDAGHPLADRAETLVQQGVELLSSAVKIQAGSTVINAEADGLRFRRRHTAGRAMLRRSAMRDSDAPLETARLSRMALDIGGDPPS